MSYAAEPVGRGLLRGAPQEEAAPPHRGSGQLLEAHRPSLHRFLRRRLRSHDDPEDYVQEVYLRVLAADPGQDKVRNLRGFLFRAASNLLIDRHRRREASMEAAHIALDETLRDDGTSDPERMMIGRNTLDHLGDALKTLPPVARDAFLLVRVEGLSHRDAAERLGIETKAVSRHVERSLARLAATLLDSGR
ncbi:RNA polymerase sigma factor [Sphingomonas gei]|uniref:RNA polymerase sigma factor n=1 Tax=Sphingomonas gei TaxID=1395960 RepID=UPI0014421C17|nr:RNA polymerase sigma factor [Sphingomonas gei]